MSFILETSTVYLVVVYRGFILIFLNITIDKNMTGLQDLSDRFITRVATYSNIDLEKRFTEDFRES